jgi:sigma-E factor negative regulatory protein RseC
MCIASGGNEQIIEVADESGTFRVNDAVILSGESSMGIEAVWLAFIVPLILVVAAIVITTRFHWTDGMSALAGLSLLIPYYVVIYLLRDTMKKKFVFTIKKINT